MNPIERLRERLAARFPSLPVRLTQPYLQDGFWNLSLIRPNDLAPVVIEWKAELGFGVSTPEEGDLGVGVDEIYSDSGATYNRVVEMVLADGVTAEHPAALKNPLPL